MDNVNNKITVDGKEFELISITDKKEWGTTTVICKECKKESIIFHIMPLTLPWWCVDCEMKQLKKG